MNTIGLLPVPNPTLRVGNIPAWQLEVMKLQASHVAIEQALRNPSGLSTEVLTCFYALREELVSTMEDFLDELDKADAKPCSSADMTSVLNKHAGTMKKLNNRAGLLLQKPAQ